jgi:hypothetical protein
VIGLGVLGLLSHVAAERPLICLIDDQQWLDRCSAQVLGFVARRLGAESVGMVFATRDRDPGGDGEGLAQLEVSGLSEAEAGELLDAVLTVPIDKRVRDHTGRRRTRSAGRRTAPWPSPPTGGSTPTGAPGTVPRPPPAPMRRSPPSSRTPPPGRGRAADWPARPPSWPRPPP